MRLGRQHRLILPQSCQVLVLSTDFPTPWLQASPMQGHGLEGTKENATWSDPKNILQGEQEVPSLAT